MSYTVRYSGTKAERNAAALADCLSYLGMDRVRKVDAYLDSVYSPEQGLSRAFVQSAIFGLSFAGIQGLPARAYIRRFIANKRAIQ